MLQTTDVVERLNFGGFDLRFIFIPFGRCCYEATSGKPERAYF